MRVLFYVMMICAVVQSVSAQTAVPPALGNGTSGNPYQISSLENLYWIAADNSVVPNPTQASRWSSAYIQVDDMMLQ